MCMGVQLQAWMYNCSTNAYVYVHVCTVQTDMYVYCPCAWTHAQVHVCMHRYAHIDVHCVKVCMYVCICTHICGRYPPSSLAVGLMCAWMFSVLTIILPNTSNLSPFFPAFHSHILISGRGPTQRWTKLPTNPLFHCHMRGPGGIQFPLISLIGPE